MEVNGDACDLIVEKRNKWNLDMKSARFPLFIVSLAFFEALLFCFPRWHSMYPFGGIHESMRHFRYSLPAVPNPEWWQIDEERCVVEMVLLLFLPLFFVAIRLIVQGLREMRAERVRMVH